MSSSTTPSNYHFHKESTSNAMREHLRAFEYAKMQRIVRANANGPAGAGIRRKSSARQQDGPTSDTVPLIPGKKAHWTTEERWASDKTDAGEASEKAEPREANDRRGTMVTTQETPEQVEQAQEQSARKSSLGSKLGAAAFQTATGYVNKRDKYAMYPI
jgi:hypothetical protein